MNKRILIFSAVCLAAMVSHSAVPFKIGIAGYTFSRVELAKALKTMKRIDCKILCHKDNFVKYDASGEELERYKALLAKHGVVTLATGPLYAKDEKTLRSQFEFAKKLGLKVVVGVPYEVLPGKKDEWGPNRIESERLLDVIDKLVKEYDICYAIHNHGPDTPTLFPTAKSTLETIGNRDKRIGVCLDIGHCRRAGLDPIDFIRENADRIYDVHIKNIVVDKAKNIAKEAPRGELDIPGVFRALAKVGYRGVCHIEYEKDFKDNAMGLAESYGYFLGVADAISPQCE